MNCTRNNPYPEDDLPASIAVSYEILVEEPEPGVFAAEMEDVPGLGGWGLCREEAAEDLMDLYMGIPWN
jgi:hypothetical protein